MTPTVSIGLIGLLLSAAPAWAADDAAEVDFVTRASIANIFAVAESRLALDRTGAPQVAGFARRLVDDHGAAQTALETAADGSGARVPTALDPDHQARMTALKDKAGAAFDKTYLADQAETHSNALTLYADYMLLGDNAKLKALAIRMIPITGAQLKDAEAVPSR